MTHAKVRILTCASAFKTVLSPLDSRFCYRKFEVAKAILRRDQDLNLSLCWVLCDSALCLGKRETENQALFGKAFGNLPFYSYGLMQESSQTHLTAPGLFQVFFPFSSIPPPLEIKRTALCMLRNRS